MSLGKYSSIEMITKHPAHKRLIKPNGFLNSNAKTKLQSKNKLILQSSRGEISSQGVEKRIPFGRFREILEKQMVKSVISR